MRRPALLPLLLAAALAPAALGAQAPAAPAAAARTGDAVAARALPRGWTLAEGDIAAAPAEGAPRPTVLADRAALVGWTTRRALAAGEPLRAPAVAPPTLVAFGQPVRVVWQDAGIQVTVAGTASGSAGLGQRVAVRVDGGGRTRRLEGVVAGPGLVRLQ